ncbi:hypothetical protein ASD76_07250 [Altererythrobacter sp. Root672]|nr:hypothetical protein ASD76_07250 [Altererythrobacter sp. Root672]
MSVLLAAATFAAPASAQSFVGEWRATAQAPDGEISETLTVEKTADGFSVTAKDVQPPPAEGMSAGPGMEIKLEGDSFSYKRIVSTPQGPLEIVYNGTVTGDTFTGTGEIMGFSVPYNGVRVKK